MVPLSFKQITERLKTIDFPEVDVVIGIGSGGVPAATMLAYHLDTELLVMTLNYRDEKNNPRYNEPKVLEKANWKLEGKRILLVDDVSVSGKTMEAALKQLEGLNVKTCAMKGKAEFVLFPEIKDCVKWPWKP
ncbi:phosphoribosyltransferase [Draconibacterium sp. IB214405]|uniref:phosphoribosyltransferase n=1 Tax=Draconibacterium sp. IB214405 TaxID=3097352 RepID=UPI002A174890|nr:phosphoribosyltransferase [Draconibacterium sp. IB214405]MDX8341500.1 phosphoribosyltransferase [Draconibacterium sp. IB214405]